MSGLSLRQDPSWRAARKHLAFLWLLLGAELASYPLFLELSWQATGGRGGLGPEITVYWLFIVVPGALLFGVAATLLGRRELVRGGSSVARWWLVCGVVDGVLLAASVGYYLSQLKRFGS